MSKKRAESKYRRVTERISGRDIWMYLCVNQRFSACCYPHIHVPGRSGKDVQWSGYRWMTMCIPITNTPNIFQLYHSQAIFGLLTACFTGWNLHPSIASALGPSKSHPMFQPSRHSGFNISGCYTVTVKFATHICGGLKQ